MSVKHRSHFLPSSSSAKVAVAAILNIVETLWHRSSLCGRARMIRLYRVRVRLTDSIVNCILTVVNINIIFQVNLNYLSSPPLPISPPGDTF